ncbi:MAG: T9SS type A sorting domain-containing protein [Bacteroidota bacterium]|uniref:T9SS type A sorting domain-containing protein n=1 Tax=Parabacteroides sp. FAFU027 TaxID=2922715 RepID=UPI001FAF83C0|nr:T9SS type A sorting domain-containing protein [Parabacteroides sp. FAFU027]MDP4271267.1 T9SS type A sorting domain-containing protein [Bacteroidota bacterium]
MKRKILTLLFSGALALAYAQDASDFGAKDILIANFEDKNPLVTDSLWMDTLKTTPVTVQSANITLADNPFAVENTSPTAAKYVRAAGGWRSIYIRLNQSIVFSQTPNFQVQVYPVAGKSPAKSNISINLINDKGEIVAVGGYKDQIPQDEWTTVTAFLGKNKSSVKFNAIQISINNGDSVAKTEDTEYYIDQIGFKAPADGVELPATVFYETFGGYIADWENGKIPGQRAYPYVDNNGVTKFDGPGEYGTAEGYASVGGFTSGIPFKFRDFAADSVGTFIARGWGMGAKYKGASGGGRMQFRSKFIGTLETGPIDVSGNTDLNLSFGLGTQLWWPYNSEIANARPKVEISVDGGNFYEIYSNSTFLQFTGEQVDLGWGLMDKYEDEIFTLVEYPFTTIEGAPLPKASTINLRMSYKSGADFWIDDLWLSGKSVLSGVSNTKSDVFRVYPNPAVSYIKTPYAQKVVIMDLNGRVVLNAQNTDKVSVASLASGVYFVKVINDGVTKIGKLVKE